MQKIDSNSLTSAIIKAFSFLIGIVLLILFARSVITVILLFLLAIVFAMIINAPVTWLEKKKIRRSVGTFIIFLLIFIILALFSWLIVPMVGSQLKSLIENLPGYIEKTENMLSSWKATTFQGIKGSSDQNAIAENLPSLTNTLWKLGGYSISLLTTFVLFLVLISLTAYMVIYPRPLLRFYLSLFPIHQREKAENAIVKTSFMLIGWMRSNLIGGTIEGVSVIIFLTIMNVPGAWVWGVLALGAQMIPKVGFYIMSIPPTLLALSISPTTALWVFVFFLVMDELLGDFIMPRLRSSSMNLHPVSIIFFLLAMAAAFGFMGILLSTPTAAFAKAYYEEFYLSRLKPDDKMEEHVEAIIHPSKPAATVKGDQ